MFSNEILDTLYNGVLQSIENTVMSYAQKNDYTNVITNYISPASMFGKVDEIIGFKDNTTDKIIFRYARNYESENEQELTDYSQLKFDPNTRQPVAVQISPDPNDLSRVSRLSGTGKELFSEESELMGSLAAFTGGVFPGHYGDVRKYEPFMETREHIKRDAMGLAFDYFRDNAIELQGQPANTGKTWYVARLPNMRKPLDVFRPGKYEGHVGLLNKFWGASTAYYLLDPLFDLPKKAIMGFNLRQTASGEKGKPGRKDPGNKGTAVLDPIIDMQANLAKKIQRSAGGVIAPAYPLLFFARPFIEEIENSVNEPLFKTIDDIFSAAEGLFDPLPPQPGQKAMGRTMGREDGLKKIFSKDGLTESGKIIDGRGMFREYRRVA